MKKYVVAEGFNLVDTRGFSHWISQGAELTYTIVDDVYYRIHFADKRNIPIDTPDDKFKKHLMEIGDITNDNVPVRKGLTDKINAIAETFKFSEECTRAFELGRQSAFSNQYVQIKRVDSIHDTNRILKDIPKENVIDIKPMENNTYLIIYASEDKNG